MPFKRQTTLVKDTRYGFYSGVQELKKYQQYRGVLRMIASPRLES